MTRRKKQKSFEAIFHRLGSTSNLVYKTAGSDGFVTVAMTGRMVDTIEHRWGRSFWVQRGVHTPVCYNTETVRFVYLKREDAFTAANLGLELCGDTCREVLQLPKKCTRFTLRVTPL